MIDQVVVKEVAGIVVHELVHGNNYIKIIPIFKSCIQQYEAFLKLSKEC